MSRRLCKALAALLFRFGSRAAAAQAAACRQALALGLDVSGSVDEAEYQLQLQGLAAALVSDDVRASLMRLPDAPVRILVFEWSGQRLSARSRPVDRHHRPVTPEGCV